MGRFIYDTMSNAIEIDDRTLAHLRIVVMNKMRRSESFMFEFEPGDGSGRRSFWIHPPCRCSSTSSEAGSHT